MNQHVIIGFGSIGQGLLPLLMRHFSLDPAQVTIITADPRGESIAREFGVTFLIEPLTPLNYKKVLESKISKNDLVINVSVDVSSIDLMEYCHQVGALYLDTCIEPWKGGYTDPNLSLSARCNYQLREHLYALRNSLTSKGPTAVSSHGANPGLLSHLFKQALLNLAADQGMKVKKPQTREEWALLSQMLEVKAVHCAERDTQISRQPKQRDEFVNTWSVDGFISEALQPAELGWGTHEKRLPAKGKRHGEGCQAAIYLEQPGIETRIRSWTPKEGVYQGFLITHNESISIADYFTVFDKAGKPIYRPTVCYAYHPCNDAILSLYELIGKNFHPQTRHRVMLNEIESGSDELGVLVMGGKFGAYWYGTTVNIDLARSLLPYNSATSLQVVAGIVGALDWILANPDEGIIEPEHLDHEAVLKVALPYLGEVKGFYSEWTPLKDRPPLYNGNSDPEDPWQFSNFQIT